MLKKLTIGDFQIQANVPGQASLIAKYEVPRVRALAILADPARFKIPVKEVKSGVSIDASPYTVNLSGKPAKGPVSQQATAKVGSTVYKVTAIDPVNKTLTIEGSTGVSGDLEVYYATADGEYLIVVEVPSGSTTKRFTIESGSLAQLNARDIYDKSSIYRLPETILGEEMELQIYVNTTGNIDLNNDVAFIEIPAALLDADDLSDLGLTFDMIEQMYK